MAERDDRPGPVVDIAPLATATHDLRCQDCGQDALFIVTVSAVVLDVNWTIGGWAICLGFGACPHPVMAPC
ncbi:hypothetical protein ACFW9I_30370 [[Kitasatospora] papulosa]|uniref:hypothetical protein n=1 Tax=[Kitasatospora] papulosa TaxID=1464011 RepID=UPI0036CB61D4